MLKRLPAFACPAAIALAAMTPAYAHHAMDYQTPSTLLQGLLSGIGHPIIGLDHLFFVVGAGVVAAQFARGAMLPLVFVVASVLAAAARAGGAPFEISEGWIAGSLVVLGGIAFLGHSRGRPLVGGLYAIAGLLHGYALAAAIVGAEPAPLYGYFAGLAVVLSAIALGAYAGAQWLSARRPGIPLQRVVGATVGAAGLVFAGMIALG